MSWMLRFSVRMGAILALMLIAQLASFYLFREQGITRLAWYPVHYGLVALAGYDTVKRLPLVWGALVGALLSGITDLIAWPIGSFVLDGSYRVPDEADPLIVATSTLIAAVVGAIVGVTAGLLARDRRRQRSRRSAMGKLAYTVQDDEEAALAEQSAPPAALADRPPLR
jgi:hypothetical protein